MIAIAHFTKKNSRSRKVTAMKWSERGKVLRKVRQAEIFFLSSSYWKLLTWSVWWSLANSNLRLWILELMNIQMILFYHKTLEFQFISFPQIFRAIRVNSHKVKNFFFQFRLIFFTERFLAKLLAELFSIKKAQLIQISLATDAIARQPSLSTLTFWNSGGLSFSSRIIILIGTFTKLSLAESPDSLTLSFIDTRNDNVSCVWNEKIVKIVFVLLRLTSS